MPIRDGVRALPEDKRITLFRAVVAILKENPILNAAVETWQAAEGKGHEFDQVVPSQCPVVRLTLESKPAPCSDEGLLAVDVVVRIEMATAGTNQDHIVNLWGAIENALARFAPYRGTTVANYLNGLIPGDSGPAGANWTRIVQPEAWNPAGNTVGKDGPIRDMFSGTGWYSMMTYKPG